jgi:PucR family transcriptional regulator, proline-responsive transcriptional activator
VTLSGGAARDALSQALTTAELAALDPALPPALPWGRLGAYRTLLAGRPMPDSALAPLTQAGDPASMLIRTLETYLDLGGDAQKTAAQLHLHRTSLYYRLGRIAEILQADLDDGLTRLELHLALKSRRAARRTLGLSSHD